MKHIKRQNIWLIWKSWHWNFNNCQRKFLNTNIADIPDSNIYQIFGNWRPYAVVAGRQPAVRSLVKRQSYLPGL